ncbi:hypothetical protein [Stenotrophomonas sp. 278]|uniref:hypothetical protein n=1 Tax=Stenotrophomonas sp. 278 TaxID=2479851 RepID=UPI000F66B5BB|nr:hypothetical protein [Stenotrophomonas sp. 278]
MNRTQSLVPPEFPPDVMVDPADGTLNKDVIVAGQGLTVWLPRWPQAAPAAGAVDTVELEWGSGADPGDGDYVLVDMQAFEGPLDEASFPKVMVVAADMLRPDGAYSVRYRVHAWNGTVSQSLPAAVRCDTVPPGGMDAPLQAGIPEQFISDAYLAENPQGVACEIPGYEGVQAGDQVRYWWLDGLLDDPTGVTPAGELEITAVPVTVHVAAEVVRTAGDGGCYVLYQLHDKATNASRISMPTRVAVALGPLPEALQAPTVPLAEDGVLDLADALAGIDVLVPAFANYKPTDRFVLEWGGLRAVELPLGEAPRFPLTVRVPATVLRQAYGNANGPVATEVHYRVMRGDVAFDSPSVTVNVDFHVPGPGLPDWPDPVNPQLSAPRVFGAISNQLNVLTREDEEQDATLQLDLYAPLQAGEIIDIYWDGTPVSEASHIVGVDDLPGSQLTVFVPWSYIADAGNHPELPVYYRIRVPGSPNHQQSPTTYVNADAYTLRPPAPAFQKTVQSQYGEALVCSSLDGADHAVLLQIPDLSAWLADGDVVTVTWTPVARPAGEEILTEAIKEEPITLGEPGFPVTGFVWRVQPYIDHILPIHDVDPEGEDKRGRARGHYSFLLAGELIRSHRHECVVGMYTADGPCNVSFNT